MRSRKRAEPERRHSRKSDNSKAPSAGLPSPEALLEFLRDNPEALGTREIGRAFGLGSADQPALCAGCRRWYRPTTSPDAPGCADSRTA